MHKFDFKSRNKLDNEKRRKLFPPRETLIRLGLEAGDDMADVGVGIGYFALPGAGFIGEKQKLYGLDISYKMLEELETRIKKEKIGNIIPVKTSEYDLKIEDSSVDFVLLVNVLHEVEDKIKFLEEIKRISRPGAKIGYIDFKPKRVNNEGPPEENRISQGEGQKLLEEVGYKIGEIIDFSESFYGISGSLK